jgi:hypothetical protein
MRPLKAKKAQGGISRKGLKKNKYRLRWYKEIKTFLKNRRKVASEEAIALS